MSQTSVQPRLVYGSLRAQKARFAARFGTVWYLLVLCLGAVLALLGVWSLLQHQATGWLLIGLSGPCLAVTVWWHYDLKTMEITRHPRTIDDVLAADVLGMLPPQPTPRDIARAVAGSRSGRFMALRVGLSAELLQHITTDDMAATTEVWQAAIDLWQQTNSPKVTGAVLCQ